jgi:hypothetical protein
VDWAGLSEKLRLAQHHAHSAGVTVPEIKGLGGLKLRLARLVARGVIYLCQVITKPQRLLHLTALNTLAELTRATRQLELAYTVTVQDLIRRVEELENAVGPMKASLPEQKRHQPGPQCHSRSSEADTESR